MREHLENEGQAKSMQHYKQLRAKIIQFGWILKMLIVYNFILINDRGHLRSLLDIYIGLGYQNKFSHLQKAKVLQCIWDLKTGMGGIIEERLSTLAQIKNYYRISHHTSIQVPDPRKLPNRSIIICSSDLCFKIRATKVECSESLCLVF